MTSNAVTSKVVTCRIDGCDSKVWVPPAVDSATCARCRDEIDALWGAGESRMNAIGTNGNDGAHYDEPEMDAITAAGILFSAQGHLQDRARTYDRPEGERSMGATVAAFAAITGVALTEEQGWLFMQVLKAVRSQQGGYRADSYEDGAAYAALAGEAAARERG